MRGSEIPGASSTATSPPECTSGARNDVHGKLLGMTSVRVQAAIAMLDAGDIAGARGVLLALLGDVS